MNDGRFFASSLYLHIFKDASIYLILPTEKHGAISTVVTFLNELRQLEKRQGILLYSIDPLASLDTTSVQELLALISKFRVETQQVDPHPEVYGYDRSFKPYLNETLEVAQIDVEGLQQYLADARNALRRLRRGTLEHQRQKKLVQLIKDRLEQAQRFFSKISLLYRELCGAATVSEEYYPTKTPDLEKPLKTTS